MRLGKAATPDAGGLRGIVTLACPRPGEELLVALATVVARQQRLP
jgi:hypothetical protein